MLCLMSCCVPLRPSTPRTWLQSGSWWHGKASSIPLLFVKLGATKSQPSCLSANSLFMRYVHLLLVLPFFFSFLARHVL
ncbi:hypothetical protein BT96DRAFT_879401 [Gymnopus androsaceus JB14]|uniref:Uncharacterized protein n=1 Tax=Gymnopus androsaceus JB14 TaxID=1447944 RepID=A0A6A4HXP6_9AGAR|nr:hypothetical protein BT96DRAFT_879401 [Gymnopus androsaceus JB14]